MTHTLDYDDDERTTLMVALLYAGLCFAHGAAAIELLHRVDPNLAAAAREQLREREMGTT